MNVYNAVNAALIWHCRFDGEKTAEFYCWPALCCETDVSLESTSIIERECLKLKTEYWL